MLKTTSPLAENIADYTGDAISNAHDMDSTTTDFANAAANAVADNLHAILNDQCAALAATLGEGARVHIGVETSRINASRVAIMLYPPKLGSWSHIILSPTFCDGFAEAEAWAAKWASEHRVMVASDLGEF